MLTIAICTHNRANSLDETLHQLLQQRHWFESRRAEVLIVDNGSSDHTPHVIEKYEALTGVRGVTEARLGLAAARNRALQEFQGVAIWYLDDDISVPAGSIDAVLQALSTHPKCGFFGGRIEVDWQGHKPRWLRSNKLVLLNGLFGHYDLGEETFEYSAQSPLPYGANFILRRALVDAIGTFDPELGVKGGNAGRGEEADYLHRALAAGQRGRYLPAAVVGHRFQRERLNLAYLYRYGKQKGRAEVLLEDRTSKKWLAKAANQLLRGGVQLLKGRLDRFYQCWINVGIARGRYLASAERAVRK